MVNKKLFSYVSYLIVIFILIITFFPLYFLIVTSLKPFTDQFTNPPILIPVNITLEGYWNAITRWNFPNYLLNSIIITIGSVILSILLGVPMAYSLTRFRFPKNINDSLAFFILSIRMLPPIVGIIPIYTIYTHLGLIDTFYGLILAYTVFNLPFTVWIMRGFFLDLPREIEEAALVDGCSSLQTFLKIVIPLSLSGILTTASLCIVQSWNEFIFAVFLTSAERKTIPVLISSFTGENAYFWGEMMAVATMAILPVFILILLVQREFVKGLTFGAVKG